ncbi:hypothetical protein SLS53_002552 [Cytospora paraplurivora]|uniref:Uncharacterized protein n=1 Tax=Cytospora paraplurivora TaxID=2898453 RepID=A0AAN9YKL6_9PEZI
MDKDVVKASATTAMADYMNGHRHWAGAYQHDVIDHAIPGAEADHQELQYNAPGGLHPRRSFHDAHISSFGDGYQPDAVKAWVATAEMRGRDVEPLIFVLSTYSG